MPRTPAQPISIDTATARAIWLRAQRLDMRAPFGEGGSIWLAVVNVLAWASVFVAGAAWRMSRDTQRV